MKRWMIFGLVALFMVLAAPAMAQDAAPTPIPPICTQFVGEADDLRTSYYMGEGLGFYESGQFSRAVNSFTCILFEIDNSHVPAYMGRALVLTERGDYDRALEDYTRAVELDPNNVSAFNNRGIVHSLLGDYEEAQSDFDRALGLDEGFLIGLNNRAVIRAIQGDYEGAIGDLEEALNQTDIQAVIDDLRDPERDPEAPPIRDYTLNEARPYALLGVIYSAFALSSYQDYLLLTGQNADFRIQSAAGALESRFTFDLRLSDGTWLLVADFAPEG
ncbi:MAG: tetratricopeptide repeat protein [bacterium]|nr:tetratricopeptide repeat protein [bacterium]